MRINVSKPIIDYFRRRARASKKEIFAILFGKVVSADEVDIFYFFFFYFYIYHYFISITHTSLTPRPVHPPPPPHDSAMAIEMAEDAKLVMLGTIHSHPGVPCYMSGQDQLGHIEEGSIVSGIVEVMGGRTRVAFWEAKSPVPCQVNYTKKEKTCRST